MLEVVLVGMAIPFIALLCLLVLDQARKYFLTLTRDIIDLRKYHELAQIEVQRERHMVERLERN